MGWREDEKKREDFYYDTCYLVWRNGGNMDRVERDCTDDCYYDGRSSESCASSELRRQAPKPSAGEGE